MALSACGGVTRGGCSSISSSRGGLISSNSSIGNRSLIRLHTKASSSGVMLSPSRPQPKCLSRGCVILSSRLVLLVLGRPRATRPAKVLGRRFRALPPQALELGKHRVGGAGALVPRVPQRVELAPDEDHDVFLARRSGAGRVYQAVAQAAHVAVSEPHRLELGLGNQIGR